jgi:hypothetical protein
MIIKKEYESCETDEQKIYKSENETIKKEWVKNHYRQ